MKRLIALVSLILIKSSTVLASHQNQTAGGATLPSYESSYETIIFILAPLIIFTLFLNELMQLYLSRRYSDSALNNAEDYLQYTLIGSGFVVAMALFTRVFHSLPNLPTEVYAGLLVALALATAGIKERKKVLEKVEELR